MFRLRNALGLMARRAVFRSENLRNPPFLQSLRTFSRVSCLKDVNVIDDNYNLMVSITDSKCW